MSCEIDDEYIGTKCNSNVLQWILITTEQVYYVILVILLETQNTEEAYGPHRLPEKKNHKNMKTGHHVFAIS